MYNFNNFITYFIMYSYQRHFIIILLDKKHNHQISLLFFYKNNIPINITLVIYL